ncbi:MAG: gliding motility-associated C-terminal domain-containing protein [Bacteroidota bacterium]
MLRWLKYSLVLVFLLQAIAAFATHNRAGEITYEWLGGYTYRIKIITYTYTPSLADRPELPISWGDNTYDTIPRIEEYVYPNNPDIKRNKYEGVHTYPGASSYTISLEDPNRNAGIMNIPNSVNIPFYIETTLVINPFLGGNNSPQLLYPPIDNACVGKIFLHNPAAYDIDGDSLAYQLTVCRGESGLNIPGFTQPPSVNSFSLDPLTGTLTWDYPPVQGEYNVAFFIIEYRHGIEIGRITRDMQITVVACDNNPPVIQDIQDTCVVAGTLIQKTIYASDPDENNGVYDNVTLTASGGPLQLTISPATFTQPATGNGNVSSPFAWQTVCDHVRKSPYTMVFKAADNGVPVNLVDIETYNITVVGPSPKFLKATPSGNTIHLQWAPYSCPNAVKFQIWRHNGYTGFIPDPCETGVPAYTGYVLIGENATINDTTFVDDNNGAGLIQGIDYCYMVTAVFPDGAESYASLEACAILVKDVPVITNVSIRNTDQINGSVYIAWSKPTELDTIQNPPPYKYYIYRSPDFVGSALVLRDSLFGINDTIYIDTLLNTKDNPLSYRVDLYSNGLFAGSANIASSVFLSLTPSDNQLKLTWSEDVPWSNTLYTIFRYNNTTLLFDSIGQTNQQTFADTGLINHVNYCYKVKSIGAYSAGGFIDPIINFSQIACGEPFDNVAPCPPLLSVTPDCFRIENLLQWNNPNHSCADDVVSYQIYYSPENSGQYELLVTINSVTDTSFLHNGMQTIAGCYFIAALDSVQNVSLPSNTVCVNIDSCDLYHLPNVFTPNGDGANDLFIPFPYNFVERIDLIIFNRWGNEVFRTKNPDINWDGTSSQTGQICPDGVYYYICDVYEFRLEGTQKRSLKGFVHIIR